MLDISSEGKLGNTLHRHFPEGSMSDVSDRTHAGEADEEAGIREKGPRGVSAIAGKSEIVYIVAAAGKGAAI